MTYLDCFITDLKTEARIYKIFEFDWDKRYNVVDFRVFNGKGEKTTSFSNIKISSNGSPKFEISNKYFNWESQVEIFPNVNFENISISIDRTTLSHKSFIYPEPRRYSNYETSFDVSGDCELVKNRNLNKLF
jgi:hypothetical protein